MIVAGFGFRSSATADSLQDAYGRAANGRDVTALATVTDKAASAAFVVMAKTLDLPVKAVAPGDLSSVDTATDSFKSRAARQSGSVAEASALAAAGPGARLIQTRVISQDRLATCALARAAEKGEVT